MTRTNGSAPCSRRAREHVARQQARLGGGGDEAHAAPCRRVATSSRGLHVARRCRRQCERPSDALVERALCNAQELVEDAQGGDGGAGEREACEGGDAPPAEDDAGVEDVGVPVGWVSGGFGVGWGRAYQSMFILQCARAGMVWFIFAVGEVVR